MKFEIVDIFFFTQLVSIYEWHQSDKYQSSKEWKWLRDWGNLIATGAVEKLGGLYNLNNNHWVAIVIDRTQSCYLYGDSMSSEIDKNLAEAIGWWIHVHTNIHYRYEALPITQQTDGYSCGLLSFNALAHFFNGNSTPLINPKEVLLERLRMFLKIISQHNQFV